MEETGQGIEAKEEVQWVDKSAAPVVQSHTSSHEAYGKWQPKGQYVDGGWRDDTGKFHPSLDIMIFYGLVFVCIFCSFDCLFVCVVSCLFICWLRLLLLLLLLLSLLSLLLMLMMMMMMLMMMRMMSNTMMVMMMRMMRMRMMRIMIAIMVELTPDWFTRTILSFVHRLDIGGDDSFLFFIYI